MIGIVVVSHSAALARGVAEVAAQMAPGVPFGLAGGTEDGGIGTSLDLVTAALDEADRGDGAVVLTDLGSATMTAELALEVLDSQRRARVVLVDAPLVEGALAAATTAQGGADLAAVVAAAGSARGTAVAEQPAVPAPAAARDVVLRDPLGLHARPASTLVRALAGLEARITVTRADTGATADGRSLLALLSLAAPGGATLRLEASGPDAERALDAVAALVGEGEQP